MSRVLATLFSTLALTSILVPIARASAGTLTEADRAIIAEAYHLHRALGEEVWPGWSRVAAPIVYVSGEHEFLIGFGNAPPNAELLEGTEIDGRKVFMRPRTLDAKLTAAFYVDGIHAVVMGTPEAINATPALWVLTAAHEMFHVFQYANGWHAKIARLEIGPPDNADWQLNFPFPYKDPDVCRLLHLQGYPLYLAVTGAKEDAGYNASTALEAAEVLDALLHDRTGDRRAARYRIFQEATEGVARYVERALAQRAASDEYEPSQGFTKLAGDDAYARAWKDAYQQQLFLIKHCGRVAKSRTEFYNLGMGKCLALDRIAPLWKQRYVEPEVWLDDLLRDALAAAKAGG